MRSRFVLEDGQSIVYASSYSYHPDRIEFSETDEKKKTSTFFALEKRGPDKTMLTIIFYIKNTFAAPLLFSLTKKKKMEAALQRSLLRLDELVKEIPSFAYDPNEN
jgi:hypothetical protein